MSEETEWFCDDCFYISETCSKFEDMNVCSDCGSENIVRRKIEVRRSMSCEDCRFHKRGWCHYVDDSRSPLMLMDMEVCNDFEHRKIEV